MYCRFYKTYHLLSFDVSKLQSDWRVVKMSLGYGAIAQLEMMDEEIIFYKYCCFNLNKEQSRACMNFFDGEIWIARDSLKCGEHYIKRIRKANGKKYLLKKYVI